MDQQTGFAPSTTSPFLGPLTASLITWLWEESHLEDKFLARLLLRRAAEELKEGSPGMYRILVDHLAQHIAHSIPVSKEDYSRTLAEARAWVAEHEFVAAGSNPSPSCALEPIIAADCATPLACCASEEEAGPTETRAEAPAEATPAVEEAPAAPPPQKAPPPRQARPNRTRGPVRRAAGEDLRDRFQAAGARIGLTPSETPNPNEASH